MSHKLSNYLRTHRKRLGLSQKQVAFLLGCKNGAKICRYEQFQREPSLRTALALEVVFSTPVRELFAGLYDQIDRTVSKRARLLAEQMRREKRKKTPETRQSEKP